MRKNACPDPPANLLSRCLETIPVEPNRSVVSLDLASKDRLRWLSLAASLCIIAILLAMPFHALRTDRSSATSLVTQRPEVTSVNVIPVVCNDPRCQYRNNQARVQVQYVDGTKQDIPGNQVFIDDEVKPRIAPDHRTVGWVLATHFERQHLVYFLPVKLDFYRDGELIRTFPAQQGFFEKWFFWDGAKHVAFRSRGLHGVSVITLYDIETGRLLGKYLGYKITASDPEWARKLKD